MRAGRDWGEGRGGGPDLWRLVGPGERTVDRGA